MKRLYNFIIIIFFIGCNTKQPDKNIALTDSATVIKMDTANLIADRRYFWNADWDQKRGLVMKKVTPLSEDSLTAPILIQKLNNMYPEIRLHYKKISGDTIFVGINKSGYLTRQVGSTGAKGYLAEVTYNLTEIPDINFVDIKFTPGDHASPGTYTRTDFVR